ncbi:MAG: T9SS type A sorting domain-containing protein [Salinivirgaceae bacterium]|nr:T9SS type A sorting domain-containing protein [Salinivirgaceae bacterium]
MKKGTFEVAIDGEIPLTKNSNFTIPADARLLVTSGKARVGYSDNVLTLTLNGHIEINGGELIVGKSKTKYTNLFYAPDGKPSITVIDGSLTVYSQISRTMGSEMGSLLWEQRGGTVTIHGHGRPGTANLRTRGAFEIANNGEFKMTGGTLIVGGVGGDDQYGDIYIKPVKSECMGGTIVAAGNGTQKIHTSVNLYNLEVANGAVLNTLTDINVYGLQIDNTGRYNALGHKLTIRKWFHNENNEAESGASEGFIFGAATHLTQFVGTNMEYKGINESETQFNELIINGNFSLTGEHSNIRVSGNLTQESGTVNDHGNVISLYGDLVYNGSFTGNGGINLCRTDKIQYIEGNARGKIGTLLINNPSEVHLSTDLHIINKLVLGASLYINRSRVILDHTAVVESSGGDFDSGRMIRLNGEHEDNGVIQYIQHNPKNYIIPIGVLQGSDRYYTPAIYNFTKNNLADGAASITVKTIKSRHKNLTQEPTKWLDYYWVVTTDGFGEDGSENFAIKEPEDCNFAVKQTYIYPIGKVSDGDDEMFPEYMYYGGETEFEWERLEDKASLKNAVSTDNDTVIYEPFGHIYGDYTVGCVGDDIYTGRPVLYSCKSGFWDDPETWVYKNENGDMVSYKEITGAVNVEEYRINGNPFHISPGHTVTVTKDHTSAYSVTFDEGADLGILNVGQTVGSDFGRVKGAGHLVMYPVPADENYYKMPAGNFSVFLANTQSVIEFAGGNGKLPNAIIGQVSNPLQNVILSGSGEKRLTKEYGEYINGYMLIEEGVSLNFGNTPIHIKGNWIDKNRTSSGFIAGSSADRSIVEFCGSNKQQIVLSNDQTAFYKLQINNPEDVEIVKSNEDGVTIETAKVTINKDLKLTNGCIIDMDNSLITIANAADISSASASKYVVGPLAKVISGNKGYTFPIGTIDEGTGEKVYAPTQVNPVSKTGTYKVTFHSGSYDFGVVWPFNEMSRTEYWEIEPLDVTGATARLELRVGDNTITGLNASMLNKVSIAGYNGTNWEKIVSNKATGSLPSAKMFTNKAVALDDYEQYTFGISASTAKLIDKDLSSTTRGYDVCDGDSSVTIPVFFTGSGGPYSVKIRITDQEKSKSVEREIGSLSAEDNIVLTGSDFAAMFGKSEGYSTEPYIIEIVSMKDNGEDGAPAGGNKAEVTVHYNALPVIDGIKIVGMGDERSYSIVEVEGLGIEIDYLWSVSPNKAVIDPINESTATITFGEDTEPFTVTLKAQNAYKVEVNGHYCVREGTKVVSVESKPQPLIVGSFGLCKVPGEGGTADYSTEKVAGHKYLWKITDKAGNALSGISVNHSDVENEDYNTATVTWDETFDATEAKLTVTEAYIKDEVRVYNDAERVITFYEGVAFEEEDFSSRPIVCDNTVGSVKLKTSDASCSYAIYDETGTKAIGPAYFGTGGELLMKTTEPLLYSSGPEVKIKVVAKNKGCEVKLDNSISILENPEIDNFVIDDRDLYQGKLVQLSYTPNEIVINDYSFNYSNEGVSYAVTASSFENKELPTGRYMMVEIPKADRMKGTLTINHNYSVEGKTCSNTYSIDRAISKDYLWKGTGTAEPGEWSAGANWWMGSAPAYDKDDVVAIIRPDNLIDWKTGETSTTVGMPKITTTTDAGNVKIEAGASLAIASGQKLIVHGDIENNGTLDYDGTIEFSAKTHNVTSSSSDASFKNIALVAGATVNANSNINVTGAIENNGTLGGGKKIILSGEAAQTISGSGTFTNLEVNKESGNVTAASDINIDGPLTLTKGLIKLGDNTLYFGTNGSTTDGVYTESAKSWIAGNVSKTWADDRQNEFTFPIGNGYRLAMVGIEPNSKGATFTANYSFTKGREAITENLTGDLTRVSGSEEWNLTGDASSYITLHWFNADSSGITSDKIGDLLVAHLKGGSWKPIAAAPKGADAIRTKTLVDDYSPFTFGTKSLDDIHPLPVTFAAFTGRQEGNSIVLEWATMSENNNDYFEIERSTDGVNFVTIGYVEGAGNSSSRIDYIFSDNAPEQGRLYYRLSQVDFDGTREYADKVVTVTFANNKLTVSIVPNPTSGMFTLQNCGNSGQLVIMTQNGMVVEEFEVTDFNQQINIGDLANGIYIAKYTTDSESTILKIVKF